MQLFALLPVLAAFVASSSAVTVGASGAIECQSETIVSETFIGKGKDVQMTHSHCETSTSKVEANDVAAVPDAPVNNVCSASCNTFCFSPSGGGPNEDDCKVIADAILYDSENESATFNATAAGTASDKITMKYHSCTTYFLTQNATATLTYCRQDWASLVTWLSSDCNSANNAHGGLCVAADQQWYVQVQNSG
ncbi:uncharacterized protein BXZ73DRAFT_46012 [Epithele typhae]|uniref:uncharacterized protein n=1 Tax=Epithele typhae TaxID=378194 RepID=UPI00200836D1|nr:uncharacterized protein BXZ73DRAFT_46012 [Epithele typhae]KAH9933942.1 hypothetical protein BXZ73DRAFT_46012 [Epithele typhae]